MLFFSYFLDLKVLILAIWNELGDNELLLKNLASSMHRRYSAVIGAGGSATKYYKDIDLLMGLNQL